MDVEYRARCTEHVLKNSSCAKFKSVVRQCKENLDEDAGSNWNITDSGAFSEHKSLGLTKTNVTDDNGDKVTGNQQCRYFK